MVRSPWTFTSPLNLPAMRTLPPPWILPSMVMSAAISDSLRGRAVSARATGAAVGVGTSSGFDGGSNRAGSLAWGAGVGVCRGTALSFQRDMAWTYREGNCSRLAPKRGGGNRFVTARDMPDNRPQPRANRHVLA